MESPLLGPQGSQSSRSRSSTKFVDDVTSLTSFNPFSEEDENDQSSYTLVTSLFSRMKNTLTSVPAPALQPNLPSTVVVSPASEQRRTSVSAQGQPSTSKPSGPDRPKPLAPSFNAPNLAPPLVSLTPAQSEVLTYVSEERSNHTPGYDSPEGGAFSSAIPGFPIQDDARSIRTSTSIHRSGSVSKAMRRLRGEGLSKDYWMDDENCKECYDCKSIFTTWRRKHHCRICGQIFCSRCASNVIKGSRFGHDGMVRVCNLCLEKLAKVDSDDEDDRRSVISSATSFPSHHFGLEALSGYLPQSPFAASHLFGRSEEPFNLYSIAENRKSFARSEDSGFLSRPMTPQHILTERDDGAWEHHHEEIAPFRRGVSDEDKDPADDVFDPFAGEHSPIATGTKTPVDFPLTVPVSSEGNNTIQFPMGSPERGEDSPWPHNRMRSRFNSNADYDLVGTPFIRSRMQSRLDGTPTVESGWRTRRESTAYAQELNLTSMMHLKIMLRQMLASENIPHQKEWEDILTRLALRIAKELTFTSLANRQGEEMDVRRYVKIKKIPGGAPHDSEYVDGAVITKNVAHKHMSRLQRNPRVMLVTFPLEFSRVEGQYMHFGQIVRQEKEYLGNLASRIAALRPHVVLVEQSVSRLALEALAAHNIAVARTVKPSGIHLISRMTQADVFSSIDKLALEPRLGHCAKYRIQTYDHPLIPGRRKTYMRFEGCNRDMGCTIVLRGGDMNTLQSVKKVARFLTFIVRNLKLETHLWKDSVISLPAYQMNATPPSSNGDSKQGLFDHGLNISMFAISTPRPDVTRTMSSRTTRASGDNEDDLPNEDAAQMKLSRRIQESLDPYTKTFISVSSTLRFPPPHPIKRMKELDDELLDARRAWEDDVIRKEERIQASHSQEATVTNMETPTVEITSVDNEKTAHEDLNAQIEALPALNIPNTLNRDSPYSSVTNESSGSYFNQTPVTPIAAPYSAVTATAFGNLQSNVATPVYEQAPEKLQTTADIALESRYNLVKWQHREQRRIWEWYLRKNRDDFVVEKYQCISLVEYTVPVADFGKRQACFAPKLSYITFYGQDDCALGQYIERLVTTTLVQFLDPKAVCTGKGCDQPLARHCNVYVHNDVRLFVAVEQWDGQILGHQNYYPAPDLITTWSVCRVCGSATPFIPVSPEMQRYSFAKFLELHFYPADVKLVQGAGCQHNIYQHHIRYFASKGMTVRFQADPIGLYEVVYPPYRIRVRPETQLELKNKDFDRLHYRNIVWYTALIDDLKLISIDAATGDEESDARLLSDVNNLISRAEAERDDISRMINRIYRESSPTDTLALNQVHSYRQDKIVAWQLDFDRLPKPRTINVASEKSNKRASTFGSVRAMWPKRYDLSGLTEQMQIASSSVSEAEEDPIRRRRVTGDSFTSSASEASENESNKPSDAQPNAIGVNTESPEDLQASQISESKDSFESSGEAHHTDDEKKSNPEELKSDGDSDSTVGAKEDTGGKVDKVSPESKKVDIAAPAEPRMSRLPRRSAQNPSVAELVKRYQDYLPAHGMHDLARTALSPSIVVSESEQEYSSPTFVRHSRHRSKHRATSRKGITSDFESGYAANIAPRYLTHSRRHGAHTPRTTRIPGPVLAESQDSSRRPSPEKRSAGNGKGRGLNFGGNASPSEAKTELGKPAKSKLTGKAKDKAPLKSSVNAATKSNFRKSTVGAGTKVSSIAKHFEKMGRDAEKARSRYAVIRGRRARPVASAKAKVEILDSVKDAINDDSESSDSNSEADDEGDGNDEELSSRPDQISPERKASTESSTKYPPMTAPPDRTFSTPPPPNEGGRSRAELSIPIPPPALPGPLSLPPSPLLAATKMQTLSLTPPTDLDLNAGSERSSILKAISGLWLQPAPLSRQAESDDPLNDPEHIFRDSSMVVRTDEPTSIIALALNSPQYRDLLAKSRAEKRTAKANESNGEAFMPDDRSVAESASTWGVVNIDSIDSADPTEDLKVPSSKQPWAITFESGGLTISCTVLYPEQFDALRRTYDCEKSMIESLARCVKWDASGGKSGSAFLKTRDDRFIAKELSRPELQTMATFAPAYFDYMSSAVSSDRPTLLAKIFGCFKLTFRKDGKDVGPGKPKSTQMNLLVMENLFYDRRFSKIYDLKGSTRNRHVQSTGKVNEVLLDENLVQTAHETPFYLREHSKRILRGALYNDSKFLAEINVMDYSLVCGVDSQNDELVVGIVDYIRTYTWDKKLESWVKESAFLGGAGRGEPTIVTPKQYRQRFISAMERYFPLIPDRWMKLKDVPEEETKWSKELWPDW